MFVSHKHRFVIFPDPMGACNWLGHRLEPWLDQPTARNRKSSTETHFFYGMSPAEAELAFDMIGQPYCRYTSIAIIQNPFRRMVKLYDRIALTDPLWQMRRALGGSDPTFAHWLQNTRASGPGAGYSRGARWRRFGAWSAQAWAGQKVTHLVPLESPDQLQQILRSQGIPLNLRCRASDHEMFQFPEMSRYDATSAALIKERYWSDLSLYRLQQPELRLIA